VLAAGIAVLAGCGGNPGYHQTVPGRFVRAGGPAPGSPVPLSGTITARTATGETFTATAGRVGRFTLSLPPGTYRVTGRSPVMRSGQMICAATMELHVSPVSLRARHRGLLDSLAGACGERLGWPTDVKTMTAGSPFSPSPAAISRATTSQATAHRSLCIDRTSSPTATGHLLPRLVLRVCGGGD